MKPTYMFLCKVSKLVALAILASSQILMTVFFITIYFEEKVILVEPIMPILILEICLALYGTAYITKQIFSFIKNTSNRRKKQ